MNTKLSIIILTKNEGDDLKDCISLIQSYSDEIIVIDSSDDNSAEIISNKLNCEYYKKKIGDKNIYGFDDLRNFGQSIAKNDWCLHIDVDELFPELFFNDIDKIIQEHESWAYSFSRINLPFYEQYPDYQTRFVHKLNTEWINNIHERVNILTDPFTTKSLDEYPIIHKEKAKHIKLNNNRIWSTLNKNTNILICTMFKDSSLYIDIFLKKLNELIYYSKTKNYTIELCFIEGDSSDDTFLKIKQWLPFCKEHNIKLTLKQINLPSNIDRYTKLAILRNLLIKFGLKSYHDYVLMIDSDTIFDSTLLYDLVNSIETNQCDVIAPLPFIEDFRTYKNEYFYDILAFIDNNNKKFGHMKPYNDQLTKKDFVKMTSVGTCYLTKADIYNIKDFNDFNITKCYKESENKLITIYDSKDEFNQPESEQICFFKKLKRKGYQIYADKNISILHINLEKLGLKWH